MSYDFKTISPATACFAELPLQISMILTFRERPSRGTEVGSPAHNVLRLLLQEELPSRKEVAPVSTPPRPAPQDQA